MLSYISSWNTQLVLLTVQSEKHGCEPGKIPNNDTKYKIYVIKEGIYIDIRNICIRVKNLSVQNKMEVKLLGVIIDRKLNFATHVQNICFKAYKRVKALLRIRRFINLEQAKFLATVYWFGCSVMRLIDKVHKRTLRTVDMLFKHDLRDLLSIPDTVTVHLRNVQIR